MKLWIDDVRPAPDGYLWVRTTDDAISKIIEYSDKLDFDMHRTNEVELIDIDHDAGTYAIWGGDYINVLDWLEENGRDYGVYGTPIHIHSMNPVGVQNMRRIIQRNGWKEV